MAEHVPDQEKGGLRILDHGQFTMIEDETGGTRLYRNPVVGVEAWHKFDRLAGELASEVIGVGCRHGDNLVCMLQYLLIVFETPGFYLEETFPDRMALRL